MGLDGATPPCEQNEPQNPALSLSFLPSLLSRVFRSFLPSPCLPASLPPSLLPFLTSLLSVSRFKEKKILIWKKKFLIGKLVSFEKLVSSASGRKQGHAVISGCGRNTHSIWTSSHACQCSQEKQVFGRCFFALLIVLLGKNPRFVPRLPVFSASLS